MIDFSAKIPDGIYRDVFKSPLLPNVYVPQGNHFVPGSYQSCLNLHAKAKSPLGIGQMDINGRWCGLGLTSSVKGKNKTSSPFEEQLSSLSNYQEILKEAFSSDKSETTKSPHPTRDVS